MQRCKYERAVVTDIGSSVGSEIAYQLISNDMYVSAVTTAGDDITELYSKLNKLGPQNRLHNIGRRRDAHIDDDIQAIFSDIEASQKYQYHIKHYPEVLVNNVSFATESFSTLTDNDTTRWQQLIDTKIHRMTTYARKMIDNMKAKNMVDGYIFNIINIVGSQSLCEAWKYAVTSLSNNLRKELSKSGSKIKVTTITAEACIQEAIMETSIHEFVRYETMMPSDIAKAIIHALSADDSFEIREIFVKLEWEEFC